MNRGTQGVDSLFGDFETGAAMRGARGRRSGLWRSTSARTVYLGAEQRSRRGVLGLPARGTPGGGAEGTQGLAVYPGRRLGPSAAASSGWLGRRIAPAVFALFAALALLAFAAGPASALNSASYTGVSFGPNGVGPSEEKFVNATSLAVDEDNGDIYVYDAGAGKVYKFDAAGHPSKFSALPGNVIEDVGVDIGAQSQIAIDNSNGPTAGNIYVASLNNVDGVQIFAESGAGVGTLQENIPNGESSCGVAVNRDGRVFVGTYFETVNEYTPTGSVPTDADKTGRTHPAAGLMLVCNTGVDSLGHVYVAQVYSSIVQLPELTSKTSKVFDPSAGTLAVDLTTNEVYANQFNGITKYDSSGKFLVRFADSGAGAISGSFGVAVNGAIGQPTSGYVYANDNGRVVKVYAPVVVPDVITGPPSFIDHTAATVTGTVNPSSNSQPVLDCKVEYGTSTSYGLSAPCSPASFPAGTSDVEVTAELTGLTTLTTYHYRIVATNASGTSVGLDRQLTAAAVRGVSTKPATNVTKTGATLNGTLDPDGSETTYRFEYGTDTSYGQQIPLPPGADAGSASGLISVSQDLTDLPPGTTFHYRLVASNSTGDTYGEDQAFSTPPAVGGVETGPATNVENTTATLTGSFDPEGVQTSYYFEYGSTASYGNKVPIPSGVDPGTGGGVSQVSADLVDLQPGTTYHYRIVATNSFGTTLGEDRTFLTNQAPTISSFFADNVTVNSADLHAQINPRGFATTYRFEYGTTNSYGSSVPIPAGELGPQSVPQEVTVHLDGLEGSVVYHFRVVASNQFGTTASEDQTFSYYPPPCPNAEVRQQTGAGRLPDCRAYELVSPPQTRAILLTPGSPTSPYATNPSRFGYMGFFGSLDESAVPLNGLGDLYVATRYPTGWRTRYVGLRGDEALKAPAAHSKLGSRDMSTFIDWNFGEGGNQGEEIWAPYLFNADGDPLGRLPTNLSSIPNGEDFVGDVKPSADFSRLAFSSGAPAFVDGARTEEPGSAYVNDRETNQVHLISLTPEGNPIEQDPFAGLPAGEYIKFPAVSVDGSHILMSTVAPEGTTHLYMSVDHQETFDVSAGTDGTNHGVRFVEMTDDGSKVFFTSAEQLTADDHDTSVDLFVWSAASDSVTRVSKGNNGSGDTDSCAVTGGWTFGCGVVVVSPEPIFSSFTRSPKTDTVMSSEKGEIYFYSPEQLDGLKGLQNKRNLYVYREGHPQFVATMDDNDPFAGGDPIRRMNVSPDGKNAAFITRSKLTSYDNANQRVMYTYEPETEKLVCVSCLPSGDPPQYDVAGSQNGIFQTFDGRAFFTTRDALVAQDTNDLRDVYEFVEGRPQLITSGLSDTDAAYAGLVTAGLVGVSGNGLDVFFSTYDTLVREDKNGPFLKFYDARTGGGFLSAPEAAPCAAADECHGPGSTAPAPPQFGSEVNLGARGNMPASKQKKGKRHHKKAKKKKSKKAGKAKKTQKSRSGKTGRAVR